MKQSPYYALAYYLLTPIENPASEVKAHKQFFKELDIRSRIYVSHEGINGQLSASAEHAEMYMNWMKGRFEKIVFKIHPAEEQVFPKQTVKTRPQLVALGSDIDFSEGAEHITPAEWKEKLDTRDENTLVLDVRNDYEWEVGHFDGAVKPTCKTFREFPEFAEKLKEAKDPKKTSVMMYCTGGIRCEYFSVIMKKAGFEKIYQLGGGVIQYGLDEGSDHWKGKLFVFDDRLVVPISDEKTETIGHCKHCNEPNDLYYNCANMDCNDLFICCQGCLEKFKGCCSPACEGGRVRPYRDDGTAKPFRKFSQEEKQALSSGSTVSP